MNACGDSRLRGLRSRKPIGFRQWIVHVIGLVTGIYRIIDQIHTATNATGDLVVAACVASTEGTLDRTAPAYTGDVKK